MICVELQGFIPGPLHIYSQKQIGFHLRNALYKVSSSLSMQLVNWSCTSIQKLKCHGSLYKMSTFRWSRYYVTFHCAEPGDFYLDIPCFCMCNGNFIDFETPICRHDKNFSVKAFPCWILDANKIFFKGSI